MRIPAWATFAVAVSLTFVSLGTAVDEAFSQRPERPGGGPGGPGGGPRGMMGGMFGQPTRLMLLAAEAVQKELALDESQVQKLEGLQAKFRDEMMAGMQSAGGGNLFEMSPEEREAIGAKMAEIARSVTEKLTPQANEILNEKQQARLSQVFFQTSAAFSDAELADKLKLSEEQKGKIASVNKDFDAKRREAMQAMFAGGPRGPEGPGAGGPGGGRGAMREKMEAMNKEHLGSLQGVLTESQAADLKQLQGDAFDVSQIRPRFGGPGGPSGRPRPEGRPGRPGGKERPGGEGRPKVEKSDEAK